MKYLALALVVLGGSMTVQAQEGVAAPPDPWPAIVQMQGRLAELGKAENQISWLSSLAGKAEGAEEVRFAAILLLGGYRDRQAADALLRAISVEDYSIPWFVSLRGREPHPTTQAYLRLGLVKEAGDLRIDGMRTPAVWALGRMGSFAFPQLIEYVNRDGVDLLARRRAGWAVLMILGGTQSSLEQFLKEHAGELNERGREAFSGFADY